MHAFTSGADSCGCPVNKGCAKYREQDCNSDRHAKGLDSPSCRGESEDPHPALSYGNGVHRRSLRFALQLWSVTCEGVA